MWHPTANYGTESQYEYAVSNFINSGYFTTYAYGGDANFEATLDVPEPTSLGILAIGSMLTITRRRRSTASFRH